MGSQNVHTEPKAGIEVGSCTLHDLFTGNLNREEGLQLHIPEYQRAYRWGPKQLKELADDLVSYFRESSQSDIPSYYLGSIILQREGQYLNIIDGQQRLISTLLINYYFRQTWVFDLPIGAPRSQVQIRSNYSWLKDNLPSKENFSFDLEKINVTFVITRSIDEAYTFFETQNTGGVRLSGADIIKAFHLREIDEKEQKNRIKYAKKWESFDDAHIEFVSTLLGKGRYWNTLSWRPFPLRRHKNREKEAKVDEFARQTRSDFSEAPSFVPAAYMETDGAFLIRSFSWLKALRQPLYKGKHTLDYTLDYTQVYVRLFKKEQDDEVDTRFYTFRNKVLNGAHGTHYLLELFKLFALVYVSKFGVSRFYEFSLWAFRFCYSKRVENRRFVREATVVKHVGDSKMLDKILQAFIHEEAIALLKEYGYTVNTDLFDAKKVKGRYLHMLNGYFEGITKDQFDQDLIKAIELKTKSL
ncbi:DUF262 domain-containing protein [Phaeodactylibacter xiamenensis]|uniref:DUF262 domain-containing protein n=1 Tax=Phaeodactylibacter xiamenensis TaxID=1524460 RepID=UPI0024A84161|nr:DUF262 domain-containing protein [Phaeodactylibacter xiamenensis]